MRNSTALQWFKSSYSDDEGQACLEVAYRWHKSSYSGSDGGNCLEAATAPATVHVRDSKNLRGAHLTVTPTTWAAFLALPQKPRA